MKKLFIPILAVLSMTAVSCNKELNVPESESNQIKVRLEFSLAGSSVGTRAAGDAVADTEAERTVNNYDIFFFRSNGTLDTYYGATSDIGQGTLSTNTTGAFTTDEFYVSNETLDIYVIANAPVALKSSVTSLATLNSAVSEFTQNTSSNFVMVGYKQQNVANLTPDKDVKFITGIELERIVNKVTLGKVYKQFDSPALQAANVFIEGIYIVNAVKQVNYTAKLGGADAVPTAANSSYYNYNATWESNSLITSTYATAKTVTAAGVSCGTSLYFYPNPAAEAASASSTDYVTKLVLKVNIGGTDYYYPIALPQSASSARNLIYEINSVTLRRPGNMTADPNAYIDSDFINVSMTTRDWVNADIDSSFNGELLYDRLLFDADYAANGHDYVDLGLRYDGNKILFATCNLGAEDETVLGDEYMFADLTPYHYLNHNWCPYLTGDKNTRGKYTKYTMSDPYYCEGEPDNKTTLELEDDVAYVLWGGGWRVPSVEQMMMLVNGNGSTIDFDRMNYSYISTLKNQNIVVEYLDTTFDSEIEYKDIFPKDEDVVVDSHAEGLAVFGMGMYECNHLFLTNAEEYGGYRCNYTYNCYENPYFVVGWNDYYVSNYLDRPDPMPIRPVLVVPSEIELNKNYIRIPEGGSYQLTATVNVNGFSTRDIRWMSQDESVCTVSSTGLVTAATGLEDINVECFVYAYIGDSLPDAIIAEQCLVAFYADIEQPE